MKTTLQKTTAISFLFLVFCSTTLFSQYTMQTAANVSISGTSSFSWGIAYSLPAPGTTVPAGPYYSGLNIPSNPMWYYLPVCVDFNSLYFSIQYSVNLGSSSSINAGNVLMWGPFDNYNSINLTDLDSSKLMLCDTFLANGGFGPYQTYPYVTGVLPNKVYVMLLTSSDTLLPGTVTFCVKGNMKYSIPGSGTLYDSCNLCNGYAPYMELQHNICQVTVDSATNHNLLVWEKDATDYGVAGFLIKRESFTPNQFDSVAFIPFDSMSTWLDVNSNPVVKKYRYKFTPVDSCGNEYNTYANPVSSQIYLQAYPSMTNTVNLMWDHSSSWFYNSASVHYIWRSANGSPFTLIDSLAVSGGLPNTSNYTDVYAPAGYILYYIESRMTVPCSPSLLPGYASIVSNFSGGTVNGIKELTGSENIFMSPNPFSEYTTIDVSAIRETDLILSVKTLTGQTVFTASLLREKKFVLPKGNLRSGVYLLEIASKNSIARKKIMVQ